MDPHAEARDQPFDNPPPAQPAAAGPSQEPGYAQVRDFLIYSLSLPERALRGAAGVVGGALREGTALLVPQAFQDSKVYSSMVRQTLDFLAEDVGGVERKQDPAAPPKIEDFVVRKAVGNFIEMSSLATLHLSPMLLLAVVSDVAYGSRAFLREVAGDLKARGVIAEDSTVDHVDDLLEAVARASQTSATAFDTPPLSLDGLKDTVAQTRQAVASIDPVKVLPQAEVKRMWDEIHQIAASQGVDPLAVSGAMTMYSLGKVAAVGHGAISTFRAAGTLFDRHVIDHYRQGLGHVRTKGIYASLAETSQPYLDAVWKNFARTTPTTTEDVLTGRLIARAVRTVRGWFSRGKP